MRSFTVWSITLLGALAAGALVSVLWRFVMGPERGKGDAGADSVEAASIAESGPAATGAPKGETRKLLVGNLDRSYVLYVPAGLDRNKPSPLVLLFHGRLGTGRLMENMTGFSKLADHGFIAVYPDGIGRSWNAGLGVGPAESTGVDDVAFIAHLMDSLTADFRIDDRRIYAAGMSNGGMFALRLACEMKGRFAAVASVAGPLPVEMAHKCGEVGPVSILLIHGTADPIVPWAGGETSSGGKVLSADATMQHWANAQKCTAQTTTMFTKGNVSCQSHLHCARGVVVSLCRVEGGGHTWPGAQPIAFMERMLGSTNQDVDASEMIWDFFSHHELIADTTPTAPGSPAETSSPGLVTPSQPSDQPADAGTELGLEPE